MLDSIAEKHIVNPLPLVMQLPPELSDEAAAQCLDFLYELTVAFEKHYAGQLRRYYDPAQPPHPDLFEGIEDDLLPF
jgi:hypothetical protein